MVMSCDKPKEAWDALKNHFERDNLENNFFLKKQYFQMEIRERILVEP